MEALLKINALLAAVQFKHDFSQPCVENRLLAYVKNFKLAQFQIHSLLNVLIFPNWLTAISVPLTNLI
jgi:hypothetical protein